MNRRNSKDGMLNRVLSQAMDEQGWEPELFRELGNIPVPPVEHFTERDADDGPAEGEAGDPDPPGNIEIMGAAEQELPEPPMRKPFFRSSAFLRVVAALLLCVLVGGAVMTVVNKGQVQADRQDAEDLMREDASGLDVASAHVMEAEAFFSDYTADSEEHISDARGFWPELCIPQYVPEEYVFENLYVKKIEGFISAEYLYKSENGDLLIVKQVRIVQGEDSIFNEGIVEGEVTEAGTAYYMEDEGLGINSYRFYSADGMLFAVDGKLDKDALKKIAENMLN